MNKALPVCTEERWRSGDPKAGVHLSVLVEGAGGEKGINRSLRGSRGTAGGRDGCLEVTSEQRDEVEKTMGR